MIQKIANKLNDASNLNEFAAQLLSVVCNEIDASQAAFYTVKKNKIQFVAGYAYHLTDTENLIFELGEGLVGQVAKDGKQININKIPDGYMTITSGLGKSSPTSLLVFPFKNEANEVKAIIEIGSFKNFSEEQINELNNISNFIVENCTKWE